MYINSFILFLVGVVFILLVMEVRARIRYIHKLEDAVVIIKEFIPIQRQIESVSAIYSRLDESNHPIDFDAVSRIIYNADHYSRYHECFSSVESLSEFGKYRIVAHLPLNVLERIADDNNLTQEGLRTVVNKYIAK